MLARSVRYEINPGHEQPASLHVRMYFRGDADGETEIALPGEFGSAQKLHRAIRNLQCLLRDCELVLDRDTLFALVRHKPNQELRLAYDVVQDFPGKKIRSFEAFRPIVQSQYFHALGSCLFLLPKNWDDYEVTLEWRGFPKSWVLHNSFGSRQAVQQFRSPSAKWLESVFVGGDFRVSETSVQGRPVFLAMRGRDWAFPDSTLLAMLHTTVEVQRGFWQDFDIPYYTVTLLPLDKDLPPGESGTGSFGAIQYLGTGLSNSFAAFATPDERLKVRGLYHLFNHELMHDWIGNKIRNGGDFNDMTLGWFSEGFTEYFAYKNMLAAGFISPEEYVEILNQDFFAAHYQSTMAEAPNAEIQRNFFNHSNVSQLPYKRGCIFAFWLDNAIKVRSRGESSLHDFMGEMLDYYYEGDRDLLRNLDFFKKNLGKYLMESDLEAMFEAHIERGRLIPADKFVVPPGLKIGAGNDGVPILALDKEAENWLEMLLK